MRACLLRIARFVPVAFLCFAVLADPSAAFAQPGRRPESKSRPESAVARKQGSPANSPFLPPVRMPERPSFWDEPAAPEPSENEELAGDLLMIPFQILFSVGAQATVAGFDAWRDYHDPGRNIDDRYLQAAIRLKDAKKPRLRQKSIVALTSIPDPSTAKTDLKKALRYDPSEKVRKSAAVALGKIGEPDCLDYLGKAMRFDSSAEVRQVCSLIVARDRVKRDTGVSKSAHSESGDTKPAVIGPIVDRP
ncbi:hypothetical protein GC170_22280 [bacterium]|nr:hypothetical protein [bacterium]